jgi:hypothetical protein
MNPTRAENLGVVTNLIDGGAIRVLPLTIPRRFSVGRSFFDRLVLHFSIGEAY